MGFIHSVFVYAGMQSVLTRIFQMRISRIVPNIARKTCLLRGKREGALWCVCVSCMFYCEH